MSLKRKASALEDAVISQATNGSPTAASSSASPTSSMSSFSTSSNEQSRYRDAWNVGFVPYMNSRTLKRYRDNRPDQGQIHDHTLRKLYEAQRLHLDEAMPLSEVLSEEKPIFEDVDMNDVPITSSGSDFLKQKTLESFFNIRQSAPSQN